MSGRGRAGRRARVATVVVVALVFLALGAGVAARSLRFEVTVDATASGWDVLTAVGTLGATAVALWLAVREAVRGRTSGARLVSAWVTDDYTPSTDNGDHYQRSVVLHVANESDEPVFDAHVIVIVGASAVPLGPLSAPSPIAVLPPRRELTFDLSTAMRAHEDTWNPRASVSFGDRAGRRWLRDEEGTLRRASRRARWVTPKDSAHEQQIGVFTPENPMFIALAFLNGLREGDAADPANFSGALAPEAAGWAEVDWPALREETQDFQPTSMVEYPAPYIARVKLSGMTSLQGKTVVSEDRVQLVGPMMFLTLTFNPERGWRVFGIGGTVPPDRILFPDGTFRDERL